MVGCVQLPTAGISQKILLLMRSKQNAEINFKSLQKTTQNYEN